MYTIYGCNMMLYKAPEYLFIAWKKNLSDYCPEIIGISFKKERAKDIIGLPDTYKKADNPHQEYYEIEQEIQGKIGTYTRTTHFWIEKKKITK